MCDVLLEMALIWRWQGGTSCRLTRSLHSRCAAPRLLAATLTDSVLLAWILAHVLARVVPVNPKI